MMAPIRPRKKLARRRPAAAAWTVYVVRCANGSLYTGITNKLKERIKAHNSGSGAKYTASFGPVELVWLRKRKDRSSASRLEAAIKKLTRAEKMRFIKSKRNALALALKQTLLCMPPFFVKLWGGTLLPGLN